MRLRQRASLLQPRTCATRPAHAIRDARSTRARLAQRLAAAEPDVSGELHLRWLDEAVSLDGLDAPARLDELERLVTRVEAGEPLAYVIGADGHRGKWPSDGVSRSSAVRRLQDPHAPAHPDPAIRSEL